LTLPFVYLSASSLNFSAPFPFGVSLATTWLNLMTICAWASAEAGAIATPARRATTMSLRILCFLRV
jgi:uncharacterized Ntn-hydrolase superfamily protein